MKSESYFGGFQAAALTDIGQRRRTNQDEVVLEPELGFFAVSDGMGGLAHGELASAYVKEAMPLLLRGSLAQAGDTVPEPVEAAETLRSVTAYLSDRLYAETNTAGTVMGATLTGVWLVRDKAVFVSLGDSRAYLLPRRRKKIRQITEDMNVAGVLLRDGLITPEEAKTHPGSSCLTAFVGMPAPAEPQIRICDIHRGDRILLCSDGLYGMVPEEELAPLLRSGRSAERVCAALIESANRYGGRDNISAVYIRL